MFKCANSTRGREGGRKTRDIDIETDRERFPVRRHEEELRGLGGGLWPCFSSDGQKDLCLKGKEKNGLC